MSQRFTRREWLTSVATGAFASLGAAGCKAAVGAPFGNEWRDARAREAALPVAISEVDHQGAIVWSAALEPEDAVVEVASDGGAAAFPVRLATGANHTGFVAVHGLAPATTYRCRVRRGSGIVSPAHRLRTAPPPDADAPVHFLLSADIGVKRIAKAPVLRALAAAAGDFYLSLGDWPYADDKPAARTLEQYRQRHWEVREPAPIRRLLQRFPIYAIYDDHDVVDNWDGRDNRTQARRVAAGVAAWDEFFPVRERRHRSWRWGRHAEFFMLDTRRYRSANDEPDGPAKTILGAAQKLWLKQALAASDATFKLIISSVPFDFAKAPVDCWQAFRYEREELFDFFRAQRLSGLVLLSADRHYFAANQHPGGLREFHVGPAAAGLRRPPAQSAQVLATAFGANFGEISITPGPAPQLTFVCRNGKAAELYREVLRPRPFG